MEDVSSSDTDSMNDDPKPSTSPSRQRGAKAPPVKESTAATTPSSTATTNDRPTKRLKQAPTPSPLPPSRATPDWDLLALTEFGETNLYQNLSTQEMESLIGWATHISSPEVVANPNPLLDLPSTPMRPGELRIIQNAMSEFIENNNSSSALRQLYCEFDQSALVAMGICLEEMITASLLPLAQAHVRRCRSLENEKTDDDGKETCQVDGSEWTLPPEEAICRLRPQDWEGIDTALPTTRPATRAEPNLAKSSLFRPSPNIEQQRALTRWRNSQGIDADFFDKNRETYALLIGEATKMTTNQSFLLSNNKSESESTSTDDPQPLKTEQATTPSFEK